MKAFGLMFATSGFPGVDLPGIDICASASEYSGKASRIEKAADLALARTRLFANKGPVVLDVLVDPTVAVLY